MYIYPHHTHIITRKTAHKTNKPIRFQNTRTHTHSTQTQPQITKHAHQKRKTYKIIDSRTAARKNERTDKMARHNTSNISFSSRIHHHFVFFRSRTCRARKPRHSTHNSPHTHTQTLTNCRRLRLLFEGETVESDISARSVVQRRLRTSVDCRRTASTRARARASRSLLLWRAAAAVLLCSLLR